MARLVVMPSSPPKKRSKISDEAAISSATASETIEKTVPARDVENVPNSAANARPPRPPMIGSSGTGR